MHNFIKIFKCCRRPELQKTIEANLSVMTPCSYGMNSIAAHLQIRLNPESCFCFSTISVLEDSRWSICHLWVYLSISHNHSDTTIGSVVFEMIINSGTQKRFIAQLNGCVYKKQVIQLASCSMKITINCSIQLSERIFCNRCWEFKMRWD